MNKIKTSKSPLTRHFQSALRSRFSASKAFSFLIIFLSSIVVNAQYFQHIYGSSNNPPTPVSRAEYCNSGVKVRSIGGTPNDGHIMVGNRFDGTRNNIYYVNTDATGAVITNVEIRLSNGSGQLAAVATDIVELYDGVGITGYVINGYGSSSNDDVFYVYMAFDATGINAYVYDGGSSLNERGLAITRGNVLYNDIEYDVYITGYSDFGGTPKKDVIGLGLHYNGNILWEKKYYFTSTNNRDEVGNDIELLGLGNELAIVGYVTGANKEGLFFKVASANGGPVGIPASTIYQIHDLEFTSVKYVAGDDSYSEGLIIAGTTDIGADKDFMLIRTDITGASFWIKRYDSGYGDDICQDVVAQDKQGSPSLHEFYAVGETTDGISSTSGRDILVMRLDGTGISVNNLHYLYGDEGDDYAAAIDIIPYGHPAYNNNPGMGIYATSNSFDLNNNSSPGASLEDFYLINAYFNGVTECNYYSNQQNPLEEEDETEFEIHDGSWANLTGLSTATTTYHEEELCYATTVDEGNNDFAGKSSGIKDQKYNPGLVVYPTQIPPDNIVTVTYNSTYCPTIACFDNLGRYIAIKIVKDPVQSKLKIEFTDNLGQGIYYLKTGTKMFKLIK